MYSALHSAALTITTIRQRQLFYIAGHVILYDFSVTSAAAALFHYSLYVALSVVKLFGQSVQLNASRQFARGRQLRSTIAAAVAAPAVTTNCII